MPSGDGQEMALMGLWMELGFVNWVSKCVHLMSLAVWNGAEERRQGFGVNS